MTRGPAKLPKTQTEATVKAKVKSLLDKYGWFWWMPPANGYGKSGVSDFHAILPGVFMVVETKFGRGKATELQIGFLNTIKSARHFAFIVSDKTLPDFEKFLDAFAQASKLSQHGQQVPAEIGGPMLDAIRVLQDYPQGGSKPNLGSTLQ